MKLAKVILSIVLVIMSVAVIYLYRDLWQGEKKHTQILPNETIINVSRKILQQKVKRGEYFEVELTVTEIFPKPNRTIYVYESVPEGFKITPVFTEPGNSTYLFEFVVTAVYIPEASSTAHYFVKVPTNISPGIYSIRGWYIAEGKQVDTGSSDFEVI